MRGCWHCALTFVIKVTRTTANKVTSSAFIFNPSMGISMTLSNDLGVVLSCFRRRCNKSAFC